MKGLLVVTRLLLKPTVEQGSGSEALRVGEVVGAGVGVDRGETAAEEQVGLLLGLGLVLERAGEDGVHVVRDGAAAVGAEDEAVGAGAGAAGAAGGSAGAAAAGDGGAGAAEGVGDESGGDAAQAGAGFGAEEVGVGDVEVDAGDGDVEVVLEREGDGVGEAEIDLAVAEKVVEARGVAEARRGVVGRGVPAERVGETGFALAVVLERGAKKEGLGELWARGPGGDLEFPWCRSARPGERRARWGSAAGCVEWFAERPPVRRLRGERCSPT